MSNPDGTERRNGLRLGPEHRRPPSFDEAMEVVDKKTRRVVSILLAGGAVVAMLAGWGVVANPLQTKAAADDMQAKNKTEFDGLRARIGATESTLGDILRDGKENKELQLIDRIQKLDDRLRTTSPSSDMYADFRQQRNVADQQLKRVQRELGR